MEQITISLEEYKSLLETKVLMQNAERMIRKNLDKQFTGEDIADLLGVEI